MLFRSELEAKMDLIDPKLRWVVLQKIADNGFKRLKQESGYSYSHLREMYSQAVKTIKSQE